MLAAALDLPPYEKVTGASVTGAADSPSTDLLAAWLAVRLRIPVSRYKATSGGGMVSVVLERRSGNVQLVRPDQKNGTLTQPGQPERRIALHRRSVRDCLVEELRRLDADEIYAETVRGLGKVVRGRTPAPRPSTKTTATKTVSPAPAAAPSADEAEPAAEPAAQAAPKRSATRTSAKTAAGTGTASAKTAAAARRPRATATKSAEATP
jgi:hypothetical protein